ncbi:MAG: response regulator [Anaerolineales bacterium]|nr:response regulator [Anaerolineales bacterium]MCS7248883.1 response regulator [Anaerolineales bacterium]MDW8162696.1 response regulator [Anaerolineales bacterium]MDW8448033.1 response regulator [Anaerolineales bacterium]
MELKQQQPIRILLVEDNPDHAELIHRVFRSCLVGNTFSHVEDGEQALAYLDREGKFADDQRYPYPDLILLDLRLPKMDGFQLLERIKSSPCHRHIVVIVLSSSREEVDVQRAYQAHANSYLVKPFSVDEMTEVLRYLGLYWLKWNVYAKRRP